MLKRPPILGIALVAVIFSAHFIHSNIYLLFAGLEETGIHLDGDTLRPLVAAVDPRSPAQRAGLQVNDVLLTFNGIALRNRFEYLGREQVIHRGEKLALGVKRGDESATVVLDLSGSYWNSLTPVDRATQIFWILVGILELTLAILLAASRPRDGTALLAALFLASLTSLYPHQTGYQTAVLHLPFLLKLIVIPADWANFFVLCTAFGFLVAFPRPIFRSSRARFLLAAPPALCYAYIGWLNYPNTFGDISKTFDALPARWLPYLEKPISWLLLAYGLSGLVALFYNYARCTPLERKRVRLVMLGALIGFGSVLPAAIIRNASYSDVLIRSGLPGIGFGILRLVFLASFVYAVIQYRVFEIPVLLQRSFRYLLVQRGFLLLLIVLGLGVTLALAQGFDSQYPQQAHLALPAGALFAVALVWGGTAVHRRVSQRIDRVFFRDVYDAEKLLQDLAEQARTANTRSELAELLRTQLHEALHPANIAIYLEHRRGELKVESGEVPETLRSIGSEASLMKELAERGRPLEVLERLVSGDDLAGLRALDPEVLVPMLGRQHPIRGLIVLGPKLSEEPYSSDDLRLLRSVANQAGIATEAIALAEDIAQRLQAEQMVAHELEIARSVQSKLLPQAVPQLRTLECAGTCMQARAVGGDYYDFIEYGDGKVGIVLADISGKGISAALLMANLQANLRSQRVSDAESLKAVFEVVNRLFLRSIESGNFATMFFGLYDDRRGTLSYVNCGHNPPFLVSPDGSAARLEPTATVLGAFETWACEVAEVTLKPGDLFLAFTDGVTEAVNAANEVYGDERLLETILQHRHLEPDKLMWQVLSSATEFCPQEQQDDITLVVARARTAA